MLFFNRAPVVPVLRFSGPIGMATPLRPGLALSSVAGPIEKAFGLSKLPTVAIVINSPGGSPVQSHLIFSRIRQLAEEKKKRVYVFCEEVDDYFGKIRARGARPAYEPCEQFYLMRDFMIHDPDGNQLTFGRALSAEERAKI